MPLTIVANLHKIWVPTYLQKICSAINNLPLDFHISQTQKAEEFEVSQVAKAHMCRIKPKILHRWMVLAVSQAVLVHETLPPIRLLCLKGLTGICLGGLKDLDL